MSTLEFFRARLDSMIDLHHPLAVLARLHWDQIEQVLAPKFAPRDRAGRQVLLDYQFGQHMDLGFRGVDGDNPGIEIVHCGKFKTLTGLQRRSLRRRQAI